MASFTAEYAIGSHLEIPGRIAAFAATCGWTTTLLGNVATVKRPTEVALDQPDSDLLATDADTWTITPLTVVGVQASRTPGRKYLRITPGQDPTKFCHVEMPRLNGRRYLPDIPNPTKVHCFGMDLPTPYLGFVIEFGFNQFRHIVFGTMDRIGSYKGGDCVSVTNAQSSPESSSYPSGTPDRIINLFRSKFQPPTNAYDETNDVRWATTFRYGPSVDTPAFLRPIGSFNGGTNGLTDFTTAHVLGGMGDGVDDSLVSHGFADFSGEQLLFPVNLFGIVLGGVNTRFRPLGKVRGIRHCNMKNLEPGQLISVGTRLWRVFPSLSKDPDSFTTQGPVVGTGVSSGDIDFSGNRYASRESSHLYGVAYLVGDA